MKVLMCIAIIAVGLTQVLGQQDPNCCTMACCVNGDEYKCNMGANTCFSGRKFTNGPKCGAATMVLFAQSLKLSRRAAVVEAAVVEAVVVPFALPGVQLTGSVKQVCKYAKINFDSYCKPALKLVRLSLVCVSSDAFALVSPLVGVVVQTRKLRWQTEGVESPILKLSQTKSIPKAVQYINK